MDYQTTQNTVNEATCVLCAQNVSQIFKVGDDSVKAIHPTSFCIQPNSFNIVYGPSGSGKTTLLSVLSGLQRPTGGTVTFRDQDIYGMNSDELAYFRANNIGMVYQANYWVKSLNAVDNVALPLYYLGYGRAEAKKMAMASLERVGMVSYEKKYPIYLSGGEQQRIAMARAVVNDPMFIIADEPTGNLDSKNGDNIMSLLQNAKDEFRRTIILVTHNMEYLPLADKLLHIQDGLVETVSTGTVKDKTEILINDMRRRINYFEKLSSPPIAKMEKVISKTKEIS